MEIPGATVSDGICDFDLLCACCRGGWHGSELFQERIDYARLFDLASHHRLLPFLCKSLCEHPCIDNDIPPLAAARLARHERRVLRFCAELAGISRHFETRSIPLLALKGPVLSHLLYGDPAQREFGDLDFLVRPADVGRASAAMAALGYGLRLQLPARYQREYLRSGYELVFGSGAGRSLVELHWQFLPRFYSVPFQTEAIFERSRELELEGCRVRVPGNEDLLLILCVHAAKHQWCQLGMLRDIAASARIDLDFDWIRQEATRLGAMRIVTISLFLARIFFGTDVQAGLMPSKLDASSEKIASTIAQKLRRAESLQLESLGYFRLMMQVRERWSDRARFAWRLASTPGIEEWRTVALPDRLHALYYAVRAGRLAGRFARTMRAEFR